MHNLNSHKTAIARKTASKPARLLIEGIKFTYPVLSLLDWGCGKGQDVEYFKDHLNTVEGYDPYYQPELPTHQFDIVTCSYVLNVIENKDERLKTLKDIFSFLKNRGILLLTVRSSKEVNRCAKKGKWEEFNDGWLTYRRTFQKGFSSPELLYYLDIVLGCSGYKVLADKDNADNTYILVSKL